MRKMFVIASAVALTVTTGVIASAVALTVATGVFMLKSTPTAATQIALPVSALQMMTAATDLPVAPTPDAI